VVPALPSFPEWLSSRHSLAGHSWLRVSFVAKKMQLVSWIDLEIKCIMKKWRGFTVVDWSIKDSRASWSN